MSDERSTTGTGAILVVGGGISGMTAALEAAEVGKDVFLVEKNAYMGGRVAQLNQYFPKLCPPSCGLEINFKRIKDNRSIRMYTMTEVDSVSGGPGSYQVTLKTSPRFVNSNCTGCNACVDVCPEVRANAFNFNMDNTKAIYRPHEMSFPMKYVVDMEACSKCGKCVEACAYAAVDLDMQPVTFTVNVAAIVWATGWNPYDATKISNLKFSSSKAIITNMMMERLAAANGPTAGKIVRPGDGLEPKSIAFVQCAGSRDENHLQHCSSVCCMASLKQITYVREQYPEAQIYVFYIDLRTPGKYEKFREKIMADKKVAFIKGKVADIVSDPDGGVIVVAEDTSSGDKIRQKVDLAVLATGMEPALSGNAAVSGCAFDEYGFVVSEPDRGMIAAGCARKPADVFTSTQNSTAAAMKAIQASRR